MKKILLAAAMALLPLGALWAEGYTVSIQNQESWRFWYVLDPPGFAEEEPGSPWLTMKASALLAKEGVEFPFSELAAGEKTTFTGLSEGTHYLLGFFEDDSLEELPVRLIALQADSSMGARHYDVYSLPELMMAARGQGMLARFARNEAPAAEAVAEASVGEPAAEAIAEAAVEEPAAEAVAEPAVEEPAAEEVAEPAAEEPAAEEVAEAAAEEPAAEEVVEAPVEEPAAEAVAEPAAEEPAAEEVVEAVEEPAAEAVAEPAAEEPAAAAVEESAEAAAEIPVGPEVLATFTESYDPVYFTRESRGSFVVLPIASSKAWGRPGTRLSSFSGGLEDGTFTLVLQSPDGFAKSSSCFFYVFPARTAGASAYTFEAKPDVDGRAAVVLWQKGQAIPRLVGTARTEGGAFTWTARADELPALGPAATLDLTTAWLDETSGTWEEFYFTTFAVADLTR